jgi:hypothetical protein
LNKLSSEGPIFQFKECIDELSKFMTNAGLRRVGEPRFDKCDSPPCSSFKVIHNFHAILKSGKCDSETARILDGELTCPELIHGLNLNGEGRGAHHGNILIHGDSGTIVKGIMAGTTNAGTHHTIKGSDCEPCDKKGHMEGSLIANITKGPLAGGRIFASYMIFFEHSTEFKDSVALGNLEGIIVRDCT